jgi:hypothetical protein
MSDNRTPEEVARILDEMEEEWDAAPCRLRIFGKGAENLAESMAWNRDLSKDEKKRVSLWAFEKYGETITLLWDTGASYSGVRVRSTRGEPG